MKILVTGVCGQLGFDVMNELSGRGLEAVGCDHADKRHYIFDGFPIDTMPYKKMDITDSDEVHQIFDEVRPDAVIHCAAWTQVDRAEDMPDECMAVNRDGTRNIASMCQVFDIPMIYFSTDYVFNGTGTTPWKIDDPIDPVDVYGMSKAEGERAVLELVRKHFIIRTSWVFGLNGRNFVKTMLDLSRSRNHIKVVNDQFGNPTYTVDLAVLVADMIVTDRYGIYHVANEGFSVPWNEFAAAIYEEAGVAGMTIEAVSSSEYGARARRPYNSRLDRSSIIEAGFNTLPTWRNALTRYIDVLKKYGVC